MASMKELTPANRLVRLLRAVGDAIEHWFTRVGSGYGGW
jgi:hypothetical protein